mmetsp:Transcript_16035/g.38052  ORF Transcript_16035/g.38052 Transcript_16035/m.38052 type:complete len:616 (-) Transcript_16035:326-2173(-)
MDLDDDVDDIMNTETAMGGFDEDEGEFNPADFKDDATGDEMDVLKDGTVKKKLIRVGNGYEKPKKHYEVFINYTGWFGEGDNKREFDSNSAEGKTRSYTIGSGGMCEGFDAALKQMKKGEKAKLTIAASKAYGEEGWPERSVPPNAVLEYEVEVDDWYNVEEVSQTNGGVLVKTIEDSAHWEKPRDEDAVFVRYRLRLLEDDIWLYSEGYGGGEEPKRYLLSELPLAGLRQGLKNVKKGSKVTITMASEYAYGAEGDANVQVPPNATLLAEVDFADMHSIEDPNKDGGVKVELFAKPGSAWQKGKMGSKCVIAYKAMLQGEGPEEPRTFKDESGVEVELGGDNGEDITLGLEQALELMVAGQQAEVTVKPEYGYGKAGKENWVGPDDTILYHVTLEKLEPAPSAYNLSNSQKKEYSDGLKARGNEAFKAGHTRRALRLYNAAVEPFKHVDGISATDEKVSRYALSGTDLADATACLRACYAKSGTGLADAATCLCAACYAKSGTDIAYGKAMALEIRSACYLNLAACYDKIADWANSLSACNKVLDSKPDNKKALFRRGKALLGLGRLMDAKTDLEKLQEQDGSDKAVLAALADLRKKQRIADQQDKAIFSKMFS